MKPKTNINHKRIYLAVLLVAVVFGFGSIKTPYAKADSSCSCQSSSVITDGSIKNATPSKSVTLSDQASGAACAEACQKAIGGTGVPVVTTFNGQVYKNTDPTNGTSTDGTNHNGTLGAPSTQMTAVGGSDICPNASIFHPSTWFDCILLIVLYFLGLMLGAAATLFTMAVDPSLFTTIVGSSAVYTAWADVRDILNVAFIMMLLFSAFCTVFGIDKYNYKKILLNLVIMALLVNFSYPIALFIVDAANVLMYYFINTLGFSSQLTNVGATLANTGALANIIKPVGSAATNTPFLLAAVIFVFMFVATLLIVGILLLVRIIVLAILVIFSSIAFVGSIVPGLSSEAGKWWGKLFKQAFFGPIMVFMIYLALALMQSMSTSGVLTKFNAAGQAQGGTLGPFIGPMAFFLLPITILWVGLGFAQSMGAVGASAVVGKGTKFMKGVGSWTAKAPGRAAGWGFKKSGIPGGVKKSWDRSYLGAEQTKKRQEKRDNWVYGKLPQGNVDHEQEMKKKAEEYKKENESEVSLKKKATAGDLGAAYRLASDGKIDLDTYQSTMAKLSTIKGGDSLVKEFENKTK
ncbi:MAG: hypothetical protein P4L58_03285, partial [Candidatus Pacebacteria bacterium]|nr:hypothetical protein [Candidatus Paceibacterota bacterium]